jgi:hypothetical protein
VTSAVTAAASRPASARDQIGVRHGLTRFVPSGKTDPGSHNQLHIHLTGFNGDARKQLDKLTNVATDVSVVADAKKEGFYLIATQGKPEVSGQPEHNPELRVDQGGKMYWGSKAIDDLMYLG